MSEWSQNEAVEFILTWFIFWTSLVYLSKDLFDFVCGHFDFWTLVLHVQFQSFEKGVGINVDKLWCEIFALFWQIFVILVMKNLFETLTVSAHGVEDLKNNLDLPSNIIGGPPLHKLDALIMRFDLILAATCHQAWTNRIGHSVGRHLNRFTFNFFSVSTWTTKGLNGFFFWKVSCRLLKVRHMVWKFSYLKSINNY